MLRDRPQFLLNFKTFNRWERRNDIFDHLSASVRKLWCLCAALGAHVLPVKLEGLHVLPQLNKSHADEVLEHGNGGCREGWWRIEGKVV